MGKPLNPTASSAGPRRGSAIATYSRRGYGIAATASTRQTATGEVIMSELFPGEDWHQTEFEQRIGTVLRMAYDSLIDAES
jgi:hypothetical protein